jgi:CDP-diacylglycerol---serine O-phosphatidyltransferase
VQRASWLRRRATDSPRPAGRRWPRLRRSLARQVLVGGRDLVGRVGRRRAVRGPVLAGDPDRLRPLVRRGIRGRDPAADIAPVSPALPPTASTRGTEDGATGLAIPLLPGDRTLDRRIKFAIVNACTLASIVLGLFAVFLAIDGDLRLAAAALLFCVIFDGLDGALARKFGVASPFGAQMDSLADLSSFGVATAIVIFHWLTEDGASTVMAGPACALLALCAAIRLARFNVSPRNGRFFCGVPTTMTAAVLALATLLAPAMPVGLQVAAVALVALAMVSSFPYAKLARVLRLPPWVWIIPAIGAMISVPVTFAVIVTAYLVSGPVLWWHQRSEPTNLTTA